MEDWTLSDKLMYLATMVAELEEENMNLTVDDGEYEEAILEALGSIRKAAERIEYELQVADETYMRTR